MWSRSGCVVTSHSSVRTPCRRSQGRTVRRPSSEVVIAAFTDNIHDQELAQILTACLSAILYKVSSRTSDTNDTWIDRNVPRGARLSPDRAGVTW